MNGVEFSAETRVAIGTNLHASFLHRKWTWALQCYLQTSSSSWCLACYFVRRGLMSQEIAFLFTLCFFLIFLLKLFLFDFTSKLFFFLMPVMETVKLKTTADFGQR